MATTANKNHAISIYFCGGAGMNIGDLFIQATKDNPIIRECVKTHFIDTSRANNRAVHSEEVNTLIVGEQNGSGKRRDLNYNGIKESVPEILHKFQPGTFNIIVHSAGGGSGSTIANVLTAQLHDDDQSVVSFCIGSTDSKKEAQNTLQTLLSYEQISKNKNKPVVVHYKENTQETPRAEVDLKVVSNLSLMCLMFACVAEKIDVSDLTHFLNYPTVTDFAPALVGIELFTDNPMLTNGEHVYSVTTLASADTSTVFTPLPEYQSAGFLTGELSTIFGDVKLMHWVVLGGTLTDAVTRIRDLLDNFKSAAKAHKPVSYLGNQTKADTDDGIFY